MDTSVIATNNSRRQALSSPTPSSPLSEPPSPLPSTVSTTTPIRSSARVAAASRARRNQVITSNNAASTSRQSTRTRRPAQTTLVADRKGKKRALEPVDSEESESEEQPARKRLRTSRTTSSKKEMSKKSVKTKSAYGDAGPSRIQQEDVEMADSSDFIQEDEETKNVMDLAQPDSSLMIKDESDPPIASTSNPVPVSDPVVPVTTSSSASGSGTNTPAVPAVAVPEAAPPSTSSAPPPPPPEPTFASIMGLSGEFQYGAYMASLGTRLKSILTNIKPAADPTTRLVALQDLSEILSMSTEDNLNGYFAMDEFVRVLVRIMGGGRKEDEEGEGDNSDEEEREEREPEGEPPSSDAPVPGEDSTPVPVEVTPVEATLEPEPPAEATTTNAELPVVDPPVVDPPIVEPPAVEPPIVEPPVVEPPIVEPPVVEPPVVAPPIVEPPVVEPPIVEPPVVEAPIVEAPIVEPMAMDTLPTMTLDLSDMDEDAALAAALAMSAGDAGLDLAAMGMGMDSGLGMGEENLEEQLLACRCLANLMEAMPGSAHTLVYHGAVPVLCSKLLQITFIDLAEQTISTLEKLSEEYPSAIVREGGLSALLSYLDFFSTHVQRTALQAAANCCRNMSSDSVNAIKDVFPTLRAVLSYSDQRLVEYAALCVIRTIESFARGATEALEGLLTASVVREIMALLVPSSSSGSGSGGAMISSGTMTQFLRALSTAAKNSPAITVTLLEAGMAGTVYTILTGVLPPNDLNGVLAEQGGGEDGQGVGSGLADMAVMQNLAGRPKEMVEECLSLVCELMPPLPRDGVFDPRGYTEKSVSRAIKSRMKEVKGKSTNTNVVNANAVASSSTGQATLGVPEIEADGDTDAEVPASSPVKAEPQEVEIADMLLVPENEIIHAEPTPAAAAPLPDQDVEMAEVKSEETPQPTSQAPAGDASNAELPLGYNPAMTNAEGEPLMAMMTDEAVADLPLPASSTDAPQESQDSQPSSSSVPADSAPAIPPDVAAAIAGTSSSSSRHRHGESSSTQARLKLLREKPEVVSRFLFLVVPILFDVFSASVTVQVRMRCFLGILKATTFLDGPGMEALYKNVPVASFIGSILTSRDSPLMVTNALQLVELLLVKCPSVFRTSLRKEGVLHEVSTISKIELKIKSKPAPPPAETPAGDGGEANPSEEGSVPPPVVPVAPRKSSSVPSDPQDAYVLRARFIKVKYLSGGSDASGDPAFESLKTMIKALGDTDATSEQLGATLKDIAKLFGNSGSGTAISSFELLKSGLVDGLLAFATDDGRKDLEKRKDLFLDAFSARSGYATPSSQTPLAVLVKRLQESLTRMESFDVVTTSPGSMDDAKRTSMALISRTLRLKLAAEDAADVPKSCQSLMVSIHAIAPFSALEDYLKPRIAGILAFRPSDLTPQMLQALAGSGLSSSALAQTMLSRLGARPGSSSGSSGAGAASALGTFLSALTGSSESGPSTPTTTTTTTAAVPSGSLPIPIPRRRTSGESGASTSTLEPAPPATGSAASEESTLSRRRSLRLRGQPPAEASTSTSTTAEPPAPTITTSAPTAISTSESRAALASSLLQQLLVDDGELDDDLDNEVGEDSEEGLGDRTFNLAFDAANGGLMASTPQGTRIATPLNSTTPNVDSPIAALAAAHAAGSSSGAAAKMSYAGAAASAIEKATDFHLEFRLNEEVLPMDMTVYGACHQHEARRSADGHPYPHAVWNGNYTITYRKIPGKRPVREPSKDVEAMETDIVAGLAPDSPPSKILRLLRVLYRINAEGIEHLDSKMKIVTIPDAAFINNKLTAKLARQLEEIMILASNCLPDWALDLPQAFGFLFPFSTRYLFLQSTSFGYARLLNRVISQTPRDAPNNSRRDGLDQYGRLQRRKVEVPRDAPMQVALKVFDLFGASSSILDVHFQGEVGTGLGPTLEFFASVCREFAWRDLKLWRDADSTLPGKYVHHPLGLFPAPMLNTIVEGPMATERDRRRIRLYRLLGQFVARSLLDSRIIDVSFNKIFLKLILGDHVPLNITSIKVVDPALGSSLGTLQQFVSMKREVEGNADITASEKEKRIAALEVNGVRLEDMCLDFTVPGYDDIELKPSGKTIDVTAKNVEEYIELSIDAIIGRGAKPAVQAFKSGFSTVFPVSDLRTFSAEELVMMFGNADEDWSTETLTEVIKADHGFNVESKAIRDLIEIMTVYDKNGRRDFLQFLTGSPKLPIGGFKALNPQLTVVRKPHEAPLTPDDYLPSVMTCAHYLKLPSYSSRAVMEKKLLIAMREGTGSFHLS